MTDVVLNNITSGYNVAKVNDNFDKIKATLNSNTIHTSGGGNTMSQELDMNSHSIINYQSNPNDPTSLATIGDVGNVTINLNAEVVARQNADMVERRYAESLVAGVVGGYGAFLQQGTGAIVRTFQDKQREVISPQDFGAKADGITDDSVAIQNAINTGLTVIFPATSSPMLAKNLTPKSGQQLIFEGGPFLPSLVGDGVNPVIKVGDGVGLIRKITIVGANISNIGAPCIVADTAPNFILDTCTLMASGANALDMRMSYRASIRNCYINTSGSGAWGIAAHDNMNGMEIIANTVSGGTAGGAIKVEQSQGITINSNIIESSLHGIWISSSNDVDKGNCNGVVLHGNYIEQCSTPFKLGVVLTVVGLSMVGNYVGNTGTSIVSARTASVWFGRIRGGSIRNNSISVANGIEDVYRMTLEDAAGNVEKVRIEDNFILGTPANTYTIVGTYASNTSVLRAVGGSSNFFDFMVGGTGSRDQVFVSKVLSANTSSGFLSYLPSGKSSIGGRVISVEVIEASASGAGIDCQVDVGRTSIAGETVATVNLSTLTFSDGHTDLNLATTSSTLWTSENNRYRVTSGTGTATFRLKITYRVN